MINIITYGTVINIVLAGILGAQTGDLIAMFLVQVGWLLVQTGANSLLVNHLKFH